MDRFLVLGPPCSVQDTTRHPLLSRDLQEGENETLDPHIWCPFAGYQQIYFKTLRQFKIRSLIVRGLIFLTVLTVVLSIYKCINDYDRFSPVQATSNVVVHRALVFTISPTSRQELRAGLSSVCVNAPNLFLYDLVLVQFHGEQLTGLGDLPLSMCGFRSVVPVFVDPEFGSPNGSWSTGSDSYKRMCWFWCFGILYNPVFLKYRWIWRLDSDSRILQPLTLDPVSEILKSRPSALIGYSCFTFEYFQENAGLSDLIQQATLFFKPRHTGFSMPVKRGTIPILYSNFLVINREELTRLTAVQTFLLAIHHGIVQYRWGDALAWALIAGLFIDEHKVFHLKNMAYEHVKISRDWHFITLPNNIEYIEWNFSMWAADAGVKTGQVSEPNTDPIGHCWDRRLTRKCIIAPGTQNCSLHNLMKEANITQSLV